MRRPQLLGVARLVGTRQPLAVLDQLSDEIGLPAGETVGEEDRLRRLAERRDLCGLLGSTFVSQALLEPLALGHELVRLDRVELPESVRVHD